MMICQVVLFQHIVYRPVHQAEHLGHKDQADRNHKQRQTAVERLGPRHGENQAADGNHPQQRGPARCFPNAI